MRQALTETELVILDKIENCESITEREKEYCIWNLSFTSETDPPLRWHTPTLSTFRIGDRLFQLEWNAGNTECQDHEYYCEPYEVEEKVVVIEKKVYVPK